ncbi:fasciclin domain-containing protein [Flavobacterium helocola]|uniref:Fasciclin domain-containing protein n=1 Tax=Flavobacterium helocola TaxID=3139139 RepID=A0ABU9I720_9FLAO
MKNYAKLIKLTLLVITSTLMFSCSEDDSTIQNGSLSEFFSKNPEFTNLYAALEKAELVETLNQGGTFTVFAPTNTAFAEFLSANGFADLEAVPTPLLKEVLLNHVLNARVPSSDVSTGYVKTLGKGSASATNTLSMFINVTDDGVRINGVANVTAFDINCNNGVVHVVDDVIGLPTVVTHAVANPNFSTLVSLLSQQNLVSTLSSSDAPAPFTVFAPLDSAFDTATLNLYGTLSSSQRTAVLTYHVVGGANVLSNAIPTGSITTLETGTFTITGTTIRDEQMRNTSIVLTDVQASNGVIHAVSQVLLPNL